MEINTIRITYDEKIELPDNSFLHNWEGRISYEDGVYIAGICNVCVKTVLQFRRCSYVYELIVLYHPPINTHP